MINYSCKNSSGFLALHIRKNRSGTAVTRAGLDGQQELLQMWRDLILEFHIPEILLIRKLLALRVDPLCYGKHLRCQREEEAPGECSTFQTPGFGSSCLFHRCWGKRLTRGNGERLLVDFGPICTNLADYRQIFYVQLESHPRTSKLARDFPKASIALEQRGSHASSAFKTRN